MTRNQRRPWLAITATLITLAIGALFCLCVQFFKSSTQRVCRSHKARDRLDNHNRTGHATKMWVLLIVNGGVFASFVKDNDQIWLIPGNLLALGLGLLWFRRSLFDEQELPRSRLSSQLFRAIIVISIIDASALFLASAVLTTLTAESSLPPEIEQLILPIVIYGAETLFVAFNLAGDEVTTRLLQSLQLSRWFHTGRVLMRLAAVVATGVSLVIIQEATTIATSVFVSSLTIGMASATITWLGIVRLTTGDENPRWTWRIIAPRMEHNYVKHVSGWTLDRKQVLWNIALAFAVWRSATYLLQLPVVYFWVGQYSLKMQIVSTGFIGGTIGTVIVSHVTLSPKAWVKWVYKLLDDLKLLIPLVFATVLGNILGVPWSRVHIMLPILVLACIALGLPLLRELSHRR